MKSESVINGLQNAPHRALFNALGFTQEEMQRPLHRHCELARTRSCRDT